MKFEQIRNATIILDYAGKKFLVDPWLAPQGSNGTFKELGMEKEVISSKHNELAMPICSLPKSVAEILNGVDYYIITHIHPDHIDMYPDGTVGKDLNHNTPVFVQNKDDAEVLKKSGFTDVQVMTENTQIGEITLIKTPALHGTKVPCGKASGFILQHKNEKSVYVAGDTIFYDEVQKTLQQYQPEVIILNACAATFNTFGRLIMDDSDVANVYELCPNAKIIASHMDNVAHATLNRQTLSEKLRSQFVGTCLLALKNDLKYEGLKTKQILSGIESTITDLLEDKDLNKAQKLVILKNKVLDSQDVRDLKAENIQEILKKIDDDILPYINDKSTMGQDKRDDGTFIVRYVGRSDSDLNSRLHTQLSEHPHKMFKFSYAETSIEAFDKECKNYHDFGGCNSLENEIHPDKPYTVCNCPVCKC